MRDFVDKFDFNESNILYLFGAFLGVISIIYFGQELILELSPTLESVIIITSSVMFLVGSELIRNSILRTCLFVFSSFSYLSFLLYTFLRFNWGSNQVFLVLAVSSAAFIALGYLKNEKEFKLEKNQARIALGTLIVFLVALSGFDAVGAQPEYSVDLKDSVEVVEGEEFKFGEAEVRNNFLFSRNTDLRDYEGCLIFSNGNEVERIYSSPDSEGMIAGKTTERFNLTEEINEQHIGNDREENQPGNGNITGNYTIYNQSCPDNPEREGLYIVEENEDSFERYVD
jgi:hypothetical protein